jgi:hypothetical protein
MDQKLENRNKVKKIFGIGILGVSLPFPEVLAASVCKLYRLQAVTFCSLYRKARRPKRIILIRHGQSEANTNPHIYDTKPDNKISLSELGKEQARNAGNRLKEIVQDETMTFFVSPLLRTRQTAEEISKLFNPNNIKINIDPRVREQEWGNYQNQESMNKIFKIRKEVGKFYYRFSE